MFFYCSGLLKVLSILFGVFRETWSATGFYIFIWRLHFFPFQYSLKVQSDTSCILHYLVYSRLPQKQHRISSCGLNIRTWNICCIPFFFLTTHLRILENSEICTMFYIILIGSNKSWILVMCINSSIYSQYIANAITNHCSLKNVISVLCLDVVGTGYISRIPWVF